MTENICDGISLQSSNIPLTSPLRVITHYSDVKRMETPNRPTSLEVVVGETKAVRGCKKSTNPYSNNQNQLPHIKATEIDFEKLLGHLGAGSSTPVTPTSFLNPRNITEDQEIFADNFSRTLNKLQAEQEGWATPTDDLITSDSLLQRPVTYSKSQSPPTTSTVQASGIFDPVVIVANAEQNPNQAPTKPSDSSQTTEASLISIPVEPGINTFPHPSSGADQSSSDHLIPQSASLSTMLQPTWSRSIHKPQNSMESTPHSSLPTILTIASSLKEACVTDLGTGRTNRNGNDAGDCSSASTSETSDLSPFLQNAASTFLSGIPQLLENDRPSTIVRYSLSDPSLGAAPSGESVLASLVCVSSGADNTTDLSHLRGSLSDLYTIIQSDSQNLTTMLGSKTSGDMPVALVVGGSADLATQAQVNGSHSMRSPTHARSMAFSSSNEPSAASVLNSNPGVHPLNTLYPGINGSFTLAPAPLPNDLHNDVPAFLLPSLTGPNLTFSPTRCSGNIYPLSTAMLHDGSSNGSDSTTSAFLTAIPTVRDKQTAVVSNDTESIPNEAACPSAFIRINKQKMAVSSSGVTVNNTSVACADSSTVTNPYRTLLDPVSLRTGSKRPLDLFSGLNASSEAFGDRNNLLYVSDQPLVNVKQEPVHGDGLDSTSNQSDPYSNADTLTKFQSTSDGVDNKLERKRARNRVAARRCRERKLSLIRTLENQVAERDAVVKSLEETLALYRAESERLRAHVELLSNSYPGLKAELCQFPYLLHTNGTTSRSNELSKSSCHPPVASSKPMQ